jgi:hypothetical protein
MELLLWMWFYDQRWFFNFKLSIRCFRYIWLIPLFINLLLAGLCFYFLHYSDNPDCESSLKQWLYSRAFFSLLISINIVIFMTKIYYVNQREKSYFENASKIYGPVKEVTKKYDYWIRRKSLISTPGVLMLMLGVISMFWSYVIIRFYYFEDKFRSCEPMMIKLLNINSFFILLGNVPVLFVILLLIVVKIGSFITAFLCPNFLISIAKLCDTRKKGIKYHKKLLNNESTN